MLDLTWLCQPVFLAIAVMASFKTYLEINEKSEKTVERYVRDVRMFLNFADGRELTKELVIAYKDMLLGQGYKKTSINSKMMSLHVFFHYINRNDCAVECLRIQVTPFILEKNHLTLEEYHKLLKAAEGNWRLQLLLKTLIGTGIRISELAFFTVEALLKAGEGNVLVEVTCKKKTRLVLVPTELGKELREYIEAQGLTSGPIFCTKSGKPMDRSNIWRSIQDLCKKAGVDPEKGHPHNFRRLFARLVYEETNNLVLVSNLLGHSDINTTRLYLQLSEEEVRQTLDSVNREASYRDKKVFHGEDHKVSQKKGNRKQRDPKRGHAKDCRKKAGKKCHKKHGKSGKK